MYLIPLCMTMSTSCKAEVPRSRPSLTGLCDIVFQVAGFPSGIEWRLNVQKIHAPELIQILQSQLLDPCHLVLEFDASVNAVAALADKNALGRQEGHDGVERSKATRVCYNTSAS